MSICYQSAIGSGLNGIVSKKCNSINEALENARDDIDNNDRFPIGIYLNKKKIYDTEEIFAALELDGTSVFQLRKVKKRNE